MPATRVVLSEPIPRAKLITVDDDFRRYGRHRSQAIPPVMLEEGARICCGKLLYWNERTIDGELDNFGSEPSYRTVLWRFSEYLMMLFPADQFDKPR